MTNKTIIRGTEARNAIIAGLDHLADTVKITLGPAGRNVILAHMVQPTVTKDGVSVARAITLTDKWENSAALLIKNVSIRAEKTAGDGTTTATVLAQAMIHYGMKLVSSGIRPLAVVNELTKLVNVTKEIVTVRKAVVKTYDELLRVATISANGDTELAAVVAKAVYEVGEFGLVNIKEGADDTDIVDVSTGYTIPRGLAHSMLRNTRNTFKARNAKVLMINDPIESVEEVDILMSYLLADGYKHWLIIGTEFGDEIVQRVSHIARSKQIFVAMVRAPASGKTQADTMQDIAQVTNTEIVNNERLTTGQPIQYGEVTDLLLDDHNTTFDYPTDVSLYVADLREDYNDVRSGYEKTRLNERIARLTGGVATIYVGGYTEAEVKERKDRFDDAVRATQGALRQGTVIGGGYALLDVSLDLVGEYTSSAREVLQAPFKQILINAEYTTTEVTAAIHKRMSTDMENTLDVLSGEFTTEANYDVVDPYLVTVTSLDTALSIAKLAITTEAIVGSNGLPSSSLL